MLPTATYRKTRRRNIFSGQLLQGLILRKNDFTKISGEYLELRMHRFTEMIEDLDNTVKCIGIETQRSAAQALNKIRTMLFMHFTGNGELAIKSIFLFI